MNWLLLFGRVMFGGYFVFSGINHFIAPERLIAYAAEHSIPLPGVAVALTGVLLVVGGVSLVAGLAPRIGLGLLILFLVPGMLAMHNFWAATGPERLLEAANFMRNLALTGACFALLALPVPWPFSVDELLRRRWPSWPEPRRRAGRLSVG